MECSTSTPLVAGHTIHTHQTPSAKNKSYGTINLFNNIAPNLERVTNTNEEVAVIDIEVVHNNVTQLLGVISQGILPMIRTFEYRMGRLERDMADLRTDQTIAASITPTNSRSNSCQDWAILLIYVLMLVGYITWETHNKLD